MEPCKVVKVTDVRDRLYILPLQQPNVLMLSLVFNYDFGKVGLGRNNLFLQYTNMPVPLATRSKA